ncbi:TetR/AcrR family transcriptional regulator [Streptomyces sp. NPDC059894]|uniref:TetR/AcrR family transcriptional regulator n=1 Tax=unclassified Streptomyces TaxID=2593676 RepID=UPI0036553B4A
MTAAAPAKARTPSQRARRDSILRAAIRLLEEREYEQIQIREVAENAGVALATVYRYFPSKELLYAEALVTWGETFEARVRGQNRKPVGDAARLRAVLRRTVRAYGRYPNFYRLTMLLEVTADPAAREVFRGYTESFERILAESLTDTAEREREVFVLLFTSLLGGLLRKWSTGSLPLRRSLEYIDDAVSLTIEGARSAHGAGL